MTKEIPLTRGKVALVDDDDFEELSRFKWFFTGLYAARWKGGMNVFMHRELVSAPKEMQVDHINLDKLDNRRANLRPCTRSENSHNVGVKANNTSGFKGVVWDKRRQRWRARITLGQRMVSLGRFENPQDAADAYDRAAKAHYGEFARTNA